MLESRVRRSDAFQVCKIAQYCLGKEKECGYSAFSNAFVYRCHAEPTPRGRFREARVQPPPLKNILQPDVKPLSASSTRPIGCELATHTDWLIVLFACSLLQVLSLNHSQPVTCDLNRAIIMIAHSQLAPLPSELPFRIVSKTIGQGAYAWSVGLDALLLHDIR